MQETCGCLYSLYPNPEDRFTFEHQRGSRDGLLIAPSVCSFRLLASVLPFRTGGHTYAHVQHPAMDRAASGPSQTDSDLAPAHCLAEAIRRLQVDLSPKPSVDSQSISRRSPPPRASQQPVADRHAFDAVLRRHGVVAASSQNLGHPVLQAARHLRSQSGSRIVVLIVVAPVSLLISALALFFELKIRSSVPGVHRTSPRRRRRSRM